MKCKYEEFQTASVICTKHHKTIDFSIMEDTFEYINLTNEIQNTHNRHVRLRPYQISRHPLPKDTKSSANHHSKEKTSYIPES